MEPETASFGDWLRRQREMREISLRDIADRTKISLRYLEAMEENRFDLLPAPLFAKGFLREYARYVGLSPDEVVNHYLAAVEQPKKDEEVRDTRDLRDGREVREMRRDDLLRQKPYRPQPVRNWTYIVFIALAVLLLLGAVAFMAWYGKNRSEDPAASQPPPSIAAPPQTVPVQATPVPAAEEETSKAPLRAGPRLHRRLLGRGRDRRQEPPLRAARAGRVAAARSAAERVADARQRRGGRTSRSTAPPTR